MASSHTTDRTDHLRFVSGFRDGLRHRGEGNLSFFTLVSPSDPPDVALWIRAMAFAFKGEIVCAKAELIPEYEWPNKCITSTTVYADLLY